MKTFEEFIIEDVGDKFAAMDDAQFDDWKKNNAGAAKKAEDLRNKARNKNNQEKKAKPNTPGGPLNLRQNPKERTSQSRTSDWAKKQSTKTTSSSDEDDFNMDDIFNDAEQHMKNKANKRKPSPGERRARERHKAWRQDRAERKAEKAAEQKQAAAEKRWNRVKGLATGLGKAIASTDPKRHKYSKTGVESTGGDSHGRSGQPKRY